MRLLPDVSRAALVSLGKAEVKGTRQMAVMLYALYIESDVAMEI